MNILNFTKEYHKKISPLDLEILISFVLEKPREFVLANPEYHITKRQQLKIDNYAHRRIDNEPIAYITGHKEFYGLDFNVNKSVLIPRPETEMIVDKTIDLLDKIINNKFLIIDIGTGSGNIIIAIAHNLKQEENMQFFATDISKKAISTAKLNAGKYNLHKKIKFFHGNLLSPLTQKLKSSKNNNLIILANLPYLSEKIYKSSQDNVKKFEPKTALYSASKGLAHYEELLKQLYQYTLTNTIKHTVCYLEISPEQKTKLKKIIKKIFPKSKIKFYKDLAKKWRICKVTL